MESTKTAVQVTQDLLALASARHERTQPQDKRNDPASDPIIRSLMDELSLAGDGTPASADRSDPYFSSEHHDQQLFRDAVTRLRDQANELPESLQKVVDKLLQ